MNMFDLHERITKNIEQHGRMVLMVFPVDEDDVGFCYTIGNYRHNLPELLFIGTHEFGPALNVMSDMLMQNRTVFGAGRKFITLPGAKCPVYVVEATNDEAKTEYAIQATNYIGRNNYSLLQIVGPDQRGRFPWQPGCEKPYADVPLYGRKPKGWKECTAIN